MRLRAAVYLRQGISPRRLALALALGFALGCIPIVGLPTALCFMIALIASLLPTLRIARIDPARTLREE